MERWHFPLSDGVEIYKIRDFVVVDIDIQGKYKRGPVNFSVSAFQFSPAGATYFNRRHLGPFQLDGFRG